MKVPSRHQGDAFDNSATKDFPFRRYSKLRIIKNVVVLGVGVHLLFIAYDGLTMLQSTMNRDQGIGVISQAVLYVCFCISAVLFPKYIIKKLGSKQTFAFSMLTYLPYVASNFYSHWALMIPTSILIGLGAALLWGSQAIYLNDLSLMYVELTMNPRDEGSARNSLSRDKTAKSGCKRSLSCDPNYFVIYSNDFNNAILQSCKSVDAKRYSLPFSEKTRTPYIETDSNSRYINDGFVPENEQANYGSFKSTENLSRIDGKRYSLSFSEKTRTPYIETDINSRYINDGFVPENEQMSYGSFKSTENLSRNDAKRYSLPFSEKTRTPYIETDINSRYTNDGYVPENEQASYGSFKSTENLSRNEKSLGTTRKSVDASSVQQQQLREDNRRRVIESTTARFFGFHGVAFLSSHITSNLMTYYILHSEVLDDVKGNSSCVCGADYCNVESTCFEENIAEPSDQIRYILTAVCVCIGVLSVLIVSLFLDPLERKKEEISFSADLLMATYRLAKRKKLLLLVPFSFYIGMVQGFFTGDFNKSFVGCAWGTYHVSLVALCYGAVCGVSSFSSGWLVKRLGRIPIFVTATVVNLGASVLLLSWSPSADDPRWFFVAAGLWGVFVGAIWSQLRAFYGVLFKADEEAAFAAFHVWYSLGYALSFAYSNYICTYVKIYILITICIVGFAGYLSVEIMHLKNKGKK